MIAQNITFYQYSANKNIFKSTEAQLYLTKDPDMTIYVLLCRKMLVMDSLSRQDNHAYDHEADQISKLVALIHLLSLPMSQHMIHS